MVVYRTPIEALGVFRGSDGQLRRDGPFETIDLEDVRRWSRSNDLEALGAVADILTDERPRARLSNPMPEAERLGFLMGFLGRCIRENPGGDWARSRVEAAWSAATLLEESRRAGDRDAVARLKDWLAQLYLEGDAAIQNAVAVSALERPFRNRRIRKVFADWLDHPRLQEAYRTAAQEI